MHEGVPNVLGVILNKQIDFVVNLSEERSGKVREVSEKQATDGFRIRRATVDRHIPLFTDLQLAKAFVKALSAYKLDDLHVKSYKEHTL